VLGDLGDSKATSALLLALRDKVISVQIEAIDSLGRLRSSDSASAIASLVSDRSAIRVRRVAIASLGRIGNQVAIDALVGALATDDPGAEHSDVRDALVQVGDAAVPKLLFAMQGGASREVASGACLVLAEGGRTAHSLAVVEAMHRGQVPAPVGLRALAKLGDMNSLPAVLELLASPSGPVRHAAISATTLLLDPENPDGRAVEPISALLTDPKVSLEDRILLAQLLGRTGSARASKVLMALSLSPDPRLRSASIASLGQIGAAGQEAFLLSLLDDDKSEVRLAAALSLSKVASGALAPELFRRLTSASEQDRGSIGIALSGAMARSLDDALVSRVRTAIEQVGDANRDVMIEGLGRMGTPAAYALLDQLSRSAYADDRRKVAEALGAKGGRLDVLRRLALDSDPSVQANAVWAIGQVGDSSDTVLLKSLFAHRDTAVAGNAVAAVGLLMTRGQSSDESSLCKALEDTRAYVRANAAASLQATKRRCGDGSTERTVLLSDGSSMVREHAARLIRNVVSSDAGADMRVLRRCMYDDRSGAVARMCSDRPLAERAAGVEPLLVFVVPEAKNEPQPRASFSLILASGQIRMGVADRRGAVFEPKASKGEVSLGVPVSLAR
jgi:HEAT repeat protein